QPVRRHAEVIGKAEIHAARGENEQERDGPEADDGVQLPHEALPAYVTMQHQVIAPARNARPPEDDAREADEQYGRGAEAVHRAARLAREQIIVQFYELADEPEGEPHFGF